jgi:1-deoxy-D-xylulose-5-phosphate synthase
MVVPATLFEKFGFNYIGPIDGHDLDSLIPTLENIKSLKGPQFLHVVTKKGQGYKLAEADPVAYHGPGKFDPSVGLVKSHAPQADLHPGVWPVVVRHGGARPRLVGITPAMREGSGMVEFEKRFPDRYYDVGIAEQHAVTFAAGMACEGREAGGGHLLHLPAARLRPVDPRRGLQNLPVVFALDRAGLVGADGATHAGAYDIPLCAAFPT